MNEIIRIERREVDGDAPVQTVDARELHVFLDVGKEFSTWIKDRICQYGFAEGRDYVVFTETGENPRGGRPAKEDALTLDMARELSMVEQNEKGKQARQYFIGCEHHARCDPVEVLNDPETLRDFLLSYSEKVLAFETKVKTQGSDVDAYERPPKSEDLLRMTDAVKALQLRPKDLFS